MTRLLQRVDVALDFVHKRRRQALLRAVGALLGGGSLWLSSLGRALQTPIAPKHAIKMVDRLLGNAALHTQRERIYGALAALLLHGNQRPAVVLVDITDVRPGVCALTASLAMEGRSVPIYAQVRSKSVIRKRSSMGAFLRALQRVLPRQVVPIIVTDAGFESPWFNQVAALGWHYVGRVRNRTKVQRDGEWVSVTDLHRLARPWVRCLGTLLFPRDRPRPRRLVLSALPEHKGRTRLTTRGRKSRKTTDKRCAASAREPWLLATSLDCATCTVVDIYALRMQIEQNYRDTKSHRWGWRLNQTRSRSNERLEMLMLIASVAMYLALAFGCAAEADHLHKRYQANTHYQRRVLSFFTLGLFILRDAFFAHAPSPTRLIAGIRAKIYRLPATP